MAQGFRKWSKNRPKNGARNWLWRLFWEKCAKFSDLISLFLWKRRYAANIVNTIWKWCCAMCKVDKQKQHRRPEPSQNENPSYLRHSQKTVHKNSRKLDQKMAQTIKFHFWCLGLIVFGVPRTLFFELSFLIHYSRVVIFVTLTLIRWPFLEILRPLVFSMKIRFALVKNDVRSVILFLDCLYDFVNIVVFGWFLWFS